MGSCSIKFCIKFFRSMFFKSMLCLLDAYILLPLVVNCSFSLLYRIDLCAYVTADFNLSTIDGHLGKLQFGPIWNNDSINMFLVSTYMHFCQVNTYRRGTAGSYIMHIYRFSRYCKKISKYTVQIQIRVSIGPHPCQYLEVSGLLIFSRFCGCLMVVHPYSFNLYFHNGYIGYIFILHWPFWYPIFWSNCSNILPFKGDVPLSIFLLCICSSLCIVDIWVIWRIYTCYIHCLPLWVAYLSF